LPKLNSLN